MIGDNRLGGIIFTIIGAILWSTGGIFIKWLPQDAFTILGYRSLFAALIFVMFYCNSIFKINKQTVISALFYAPLVICFVTATKLTTAANAIFLQYTAPCFVLLLEPYFFKTKLHGINIATVVLCFIGMATFLGDDLSIGGDQMKGIGLALVSGFFLTGLLISQKLNSPLYRPNGIFYGNLLTVIATIPWMLKSDTPAPNELAMLLFLGIMQLGLGFILFTKGQQHISALESSLIAMLEPILNPIWVVIGFGETPSTWAIVGGGIIIGALIFRLVYIAKYPLPKEEMEAFIEY